MFIQITKKKRIGLRPSNKNTLILDKLAMQDDLKLHCSRKLRHMTTHASLQANNHHNHRIKVTAQR